MKKPNPVSYQNQRLHFSEDGLVRVRPTVIPVIFIAVEFIFTLVWGLAFFNVIRLVTKSLMWGLVAMLPILALVNYFCIRSLGLFTSTSKILLDLRTRTIFPNGRSKSDLESRRNLITGGIPFTNVTCICMTAERVNTAKRSFHSYCLAILLNNGESIYLLNHAKKESVLEDAEKLAAATGLALQTYDEYTSPNLELPQEPIEPYPTPAPIPDARKTASRLPLFLFGSIFTLFSLLISYFLFLRPLITWHSSRNWVHAEAVILSSNLARSYSKGKPTYRIDITFRYEFDGHSYTGNKYDLLRSSGSSNIGIDAMRRVVDSYHPGQQVTCLVNQQNPSEAIMTRELYIPMLIFTGLFGLGFPAAGLTMLYFAFKGKKEKTR